VGVEQSTAPVDRIDRAQPVGVVGCGVLEFGQGCDHRGRVTEQHRGGAVGDELAVS
jgi:hypothetical protein